MPLRRPTQSQPTPSVGSVRITGMGRDGDGIAIAPDGRSIYLANTLVGELVRAGPLTRRGDGWIGTAEAIEQASGDRVQPPCRHFGACGGCTLQHWDAARYGEWKLELLIDALTRAGYPDPSVAPLSLTPPASRRRMDLAIRKASGRVEIGLHQRRDTAVVDFEECPVLHPALFAIVAPLRDVLPRLSALRREASLVANLLDDGPDLVLRADAAPNARDRQILAEFAQRHGVSRISWSLNDQAPEAAALLRMPVVTFSGVAVDAPPGVFLQASTTAEAAIQAAVTAGLPGKLVGKARIVELYAGCGTLTFALSQHARVSAYEGDPGAVRALRKAAGGRRIEVTERDLTRQPLMARELASAAAIVLDPPYAGAGPQMPQVAASGARRIIYVSCNPASLSRDAALLRDAGYQIVTATPIDQFLWSSRLESVTVFAR